MPALEHTAVEAASADTWPEAEAGKVSWTHALETLGMLCTLPPVFETTVSRLFAAAAPRAAQDMQGTGPAALVFRAVCNIVHRNTGSKSGAIATWLVAPGAERVQRLLSQFLQVVVEGLGAAEGGALPPAMFGDVVEVVRQVVQSLPATKTARARAVRQIVAATAPHAQQSSSPSSSLSWRSCQCLGLLSAALASAAKDQVSPSEIPSLQALCDTLCTGPSSDAAASGTLERTWARYAAQAVGSMLNKAPKGPILDALLAPVGYTAARGGLGRGGQGWPFLSRACLLSWVAKGLLMRRHKAGVDLCVGFCTVIVAPVAQEEAEEEEQERAAAVRCLRVVVSDSAVCLHGRCGARTSSFYKHSLFRRVVPLLLDAVSFSGKLAAAGFGSGDAAAARQFHTLHAIMLLVAHSPQVVVRAELSRLLPVIVMALTSDRTRALQATSLPAVRMILEGDDVDALAPHAESCMRCLLGLALPDAPASTCVAAVACLSLLRKLPPQVVVRLKTQILGGLWETLDHPSKAARRAAVVARNHWFLV